MDLRVVAPEYALPMVSSWLAARTALASLTSMPAFSNSVSILVRSASLGRPLIAASTVVALEDSHSSRSFLRSESE